MIYRAPLPVDDRPHQIDGRVVHVHTTDPRIVDVWFERGEPRWYQVFGTGHPYEGEHVGTALAPAYGFVWHVVQVPHA